MKSRASLLVLSMLLLCTLGGGERSSDSTQDGFVHLFNGTDLTGWTYTAKAGEGYRLRDGNVLYSTASDGGILMSERQYDNFVLRFDVKLSAGANSGVGIRCPMAGGNLAYDGMEIQILDDGAEKYARLRPTQYHGSLYNVVAAKRGHQKPVGEWNEQEIIVNGRQVTVKLNGETIVDANLDQITDEKILKRHRGLQNKSGHLGFLGHGTAVEFRNVRIKELPASADPS